MAGSVQSVYFRGSSHPTSMAALRARSPLRRKSDNTHTEARPRPIPPRRSRCEAVTLAHAPLPPTRELREGPPVVSSRWPRVVSRHSRESGRDDPEGFRRPAQSRRRRGAYAARTVARAAQRAARPRGPALPRARPKVSSSARGFPLPAARGITLVRPERHRTGPLMERKMGELVRAWRNIVGVRPKS